jgi:hypothetical protein
MCGEEDYTMEHLLHEYHATARKNINYFDDNGYPQPKDELHHPLCRNDGASLGVGINERANAQKIPLGRSVSERALTKIR